MAIVKPQSAIAGGTKEAPPAIKSEAVKVDISATIAAESKTPAVQEAIEQMMPVVEGPADRHRRAVLAGRSVLGRLGVPSILPRSAGGRDRAPTRGAGAERATRKGP